MKKQELKQHLSTLKHLWHRYSPSIKDWLVKSDGFLTAEGKLWSPKEWHAYGIGFMDGFENPSADYVKRLSKVRKENEDVDEESHYFIKGWHTGQSTFYTLGVLLCVFLLVLMAYMTKRF